MSFDDVEFDRPPLSLSPKEDVGLTDAETLVLITQENGVAGSKEFLRFLKRQMKGSVLLFEWFKRYPQFFGWYTKTEITDTPEAGPVRTTPLIATQSSGAGAGTQNLAALFGSVYAQGGFWPDDDEMLPLTALNLFSGKLQPAWKKSNLRLPLFFFTFVLFGNDAEAREYKRIKQSVIPKSFDVKFKKLRAYVELNSLARDNLELLRADSRVPVAILGFEDACRAHNAALLGAQTAADILRLNAELRRRIPPFFQQSPPTLMGNTAREFRTFLVNPNQSIILNAPLRSEQSIRTPPSSMKSEILKFLLADKVIQCSHVLDSTQPKSLNFASNVFGVSLSANVPKGMTVAIDKIPALEMSPSPGCPFFVHLKGKKATFKDDDVFKAYASILKPGAYLGTFSFLGIHLFSADEEATLHSYGYDATVVSFCALVFVCQLIFGDNVDQQKIVAAEAQRKCTNKQVVATLSWNRFGLNVIRIEKFMRRLMTCTLVTELFFSGPAACTFTQWGTCGDIYDELLLKRFFPRTSQSAGVRQVLRNTFLPILKKYNAKTHFEFWNKAFELKTSLSGTLMDDDRNRVATRLYEILTNNYRYLKQSLVKASAGLTGQNMKTMLDRMDEKLATIDRKLAVDAANKSVAPPHITIIRKLEVIIEQDKRLNLSPFIGPYQFQVIGKKALEKRQKKRYFSDSR